MGKVIGAAIIGRRLFDAPLTFVTDGLASAVAQAKAFTGDLCGQALEAGLLDEVPRGEAHGRLLAGLTVDELPGHVQLADVPGVLLQ